MKKCNQVKIKVVCDYSDGYYKACIYDGSKPIKVFKKPIIDFSNKKNNYSRKMLKQGREKLLDDIKKLLYNHKAPIEYCKKIVNESDPIVYSLLCDVDNECDTSYSIEYIKSIYQNIQGMFISEEEYEIEALRERINNLNCAGISIEYNTALVINNKSWNKIDKLKGIISGIKGIFLAKKQNKILGTKIHTSIKPKDRYGYINEIDNQSECLGLNGKGNIIERYNKCINEKHRKIKNPIKNNNEVQLMQEKPIAENVNRIRISFNSKPTLAEKYKTKKNSFSNVFRRAAALVAAAAISIGFRADNNNNSSHPDSIYGEKSIANVHKSVVPSSQKISEIESSTLEKSKMGAFNKETSKSETSKVLVSNREKIKEKIEKFKKMAYEKYLRAFIIGEKPNVGGMLDDKEFSENNNGTGKKGNFKYHKKHIVCFINFFDDKDINKFKTINTNGENLYELIEKYGKDYPNYAIAYEDIESRGIIGFTNKNEVEKMIKNKINEVISKKYSQLSYAESNKEEHINEVEK